MADIDINYSKLHQRAVVVSRTERGRLWMIDHLLSPVLDGRAHSYIDSGPNTIQKVAEDMASIIMKDGIAVSVRDTD